MSKPCNLSNKKFGRLTAICFNGESRKNQGYMWDCVCDCGGKIAVSVGVLNSGGCRSCGCMLSERGKALGMTTFKHGEGHGRKTKEYRAWTSMKERCYSKNKSSYLNYGGRGIIVCDRWKDNYLNFLNDMGRASEGFSLDRIDVNGNYEPNNCRWADWKTQALNRRNTAFVEINGKFIKAAELSKTLNIDVNHLYSYTKVKLILEKVYGNI